MLRENRSKAVLVRLILTAIAAVLVVVLPTTHSIAATTNGTPNAPTSQPGDRDNGSNSPSQGGGGDARTINPRPQPSAPRDSAPRNSSPPSDSSPSSPGAGSGSPGTSSPGGDTPAKPNSPRQSTPKPDRGPNKYSPNTKSPNGSSRDKLDDDRDDRPDRSTGPSQNRGPNKYSPNAKTPDDRDRPNRDSGRKKREEREERQEQRERRASPPTAETPSPTTPRFPSRPTSPSEPEAGESDDPDSSRESKDSDKRKDSDEEEEPEEADPTPAPDPEPAPTPTPTPTPQEPKRDEDPPARILSPPMQQADPNEPSPRQPNITGKPRPEAEQPEAQTPPDPSAQQLGTGRGWGAYWDLINTIGHGISKGIDAIEWIVEQFEDDPTSPAPAPENAPAEVPAPSTPAEPAEPSTPGTEQAPEPPATGSPAVPAPTQPAPPLDPTPTPTQPAPPAAPPPTIGTSGGGSGTWVTESTNGWSQEAKDYQEQVTGIPPGVTYEVPSETRKTGTVKVDSMEPPTATTQEKWIEAKYSRPKIAYDKNGDLNRWSPPAIEMRNQLEAQYRAAEQHDAVVEWVVSDERQLRDVQDEIDDKEYNDRITVRLKPPNK
ncbi:Tox-REase-5 domain-containing protein [Gordonia sp. LSe1-13]|uniref:Tox-REase-5 domain-containing protein n=1 Tax=Gordonia sesuvii TaxID=3116777 RepID=A0ABU7M9D2_9ACTN|nr:Tox-REase-5 domain-containing protein [Gordonia sp. LSe1-13]